jgi:low affinity Fe/Cu permease
MRANLPIGSTSADSARRGDWFGRLAVATARLSGRPATFLLAVAIVLVWAITGPLFGFSDTWQLVINTGTTIVTFLMVFLIQATQNRDTLALQLKLDELILATKNARNQIAGIEQAPDQEIENAKVEVLKRAR